METGKPVLPRMPGGNRSQSYCYSDFTSIGHLPLLCRGPRKGPRRVLEDTSAAVFNLHVFIATMKVLQRALSMFFGNSPSATSKKTQIFKLNRRYKSSSSHESPRVPSTEARPTAPPDLNVAKDPPIPVEPSSPPPIDIPNPLWYRRLGPVTDFFRWFHRTQEKRPYTTQLWTSMTIYLCGDFLAQDIGGEDYDPKRTLRMVTIGGLASMPGYKWCDKTCALGCHPVTVYRFIFLGNHFNYASRIRSITTKVVVQQAIFTPVFNTYFFGMQAILSGARPSGVFERIRRAVPESMINSVKLWPAVTAFSFAFILPQYRFMFAGVFAIGWQSYLSFLNRKVERSPGSVGIGSDSSSREPSFIEAAIKG